MGNKHIQMPHQLGMFNQDVKLIPVDKLVYVYMRSHIDKDAKTFVSIDTLAEECELNWRTVSKSIARLLEAQEIYLVEDKSGRRSKTYQFNKDSRHFEMFSQECLDALKKEKYSTNEKCVIICLHEFSYKTQNYGELHDSLDEISKNILMPISTLKRTMKSLTDRGILQNTHNNKHEPVRRIQWDKLMMEMIYQVKENTEDIRQIKEENKLLKSQLKDTNEQVKELTKTVDYLIKDRDYYKVKSDHNEEQSHKFRM